MTTNLEMMPLSSPNSTTQEKTPQIRRRPSLIQQVSTFLGLDEDENEEKKKKWDKKALRRFVSMKNIDPEEARKLVKNHTIEINPDVSNIFLTPETPETSRAAGGAPMVLSQINQSQVRLESIDSNNSASMRRMSNLDKKFAPKKESISGAIFDSFSTLIKKGSLIDKNKLRLQASFASKRSFDMDSILFDTPDYEEDQELEKEKESPAGITFDLPPSSSATTSMSESFEMTPLPHTHRRLKPGKPAAISEIPEETTFEMELAEKSSSDEAEVDPQAFPRMTARVRRAKSSVRQPGRKPTVERPCDLMSASQPLPRGAAEEADKIFEALYAESEKREEPQPRMSLRRQKSVVDDLFYDVVAPEVDYYHPDIAQSPPTSAQLAATEQFRYADGITYIDVGHSHISHLSPIRLGAPKIAEKPDSRPDRPQTLAVPSTAARQKMLAERKRMAMSKMARHVGEMKSQKRQRGIGVIGRFFDREFKKQLPKEVMAFIEDEPEEKPWFTYYVTTIQIIVCLLSILIYGIGPFAAGVVENSGNVQDITLTLRRVSFEEPGNLWLGPSYSSLIHLGAKYSPCMRAERQLIEAIEEDRRKENSTGCCVTNDGGCYQSTRYLCPEGYARWNRWDFYKAARNLTREPVSGLRRTQSESFLLKNSNSLSLSKKNSVCGQDPDYCDFPISTGAHKWPPEDITKWPICEKKHGGSGQPEWMTCQVTGRPCCIQLQGLCRIATKEYCDFVRGYYHEEATLCSQVNCFDDVCGMTPRFGDHPDQRIRLILPIFVHAGIFHLLLTCIFQLTIMADLEKLLGWKRMGLVYMTAGIGGNLASSIFMPFHPEVGPSGSQCGVFSAVLFEAYTHRHLIQDMTQVYFINICTFLVIIIAGIFPWIDNWSHIFGFIFGGLTTIVIFPYIDFLPESSPDAQKTWKIQPSSSPLAPASSISPVLMVPRTSGGPGIPEDPQSGCFWEFWRVFMALKKSRKRLISKLLAFLLATHLFSILLICFIWNIEIDCPWCIYLNCPPFLDGCQNQGLKLKKWLPI
ncbi:unnamed protein product [Caenorhabditis angaria]|uniref:Peptidase S54 rhomboid domain-containing protein n=1 Tax=Caenorhabditis angaria TaxID=860376 RepID=A0A9P1N0C6_9PELO|nr:unnamed protein product [Caenorhabditis angaria]